MCGIVGIYDRSNKIDKEELKVATNVLEHRGPDGFDYYFDNNIAFGHRRLSIIDLSEKAKQPMSNESGEIWIVYNGEIYNFMDLRKELESLGHEFRSRSDTEVIIHAYEEWGEWCVQRFNGMFAFAIWDGKNKKLFLARDRTGVKPLYYFLDGERFIFASEIKAILKFNVPRELNYNVLYDYFNYFILVGEETLFKNIKSLPPAHYFVLQNNKITARKYWDFDYATEQRTESEWIKLLNQGIAESIKKRMIADVPIGAFISGGIDSSAIVALMQKFTDKVRTFCVGSGDETELTNARFIAQALSTEHNEILITPDDFAKNLQRMVWHYDMPISFASSIPLYFVSRLSKGKATVVLTGEGADELFAGYNRYNLILRASKLNKIAKVLPKGIRTSSLSMLDNYLTDPRYKKNIEMLVQGFNFDYATGINILVGKERDLLLQNIPKEKKWNEKVIKLYNEKSTDFLNRILFIDFKTYLVELLMKQDKMSMAASIESRVPFLDYRIVEMAARIPSGLKLNRNVGKYILKKSLEKILPKKVIYQKKIGFSVPINKWFRNELNGFLRDKLLDDSKLLNKFFDISRVKKMIELQKNKNYSLQLWAILNFKIWLEEFDIQI